MLCDPMDCRLLCPPLSPRACSNSCPLSWWCYTTMSSSAAFFSFCLLSFPASRSFPMSQLFASGGQSIRASATDLSNEYSGLISLGLTDSISLLVKGLSRVFSNTTIEKHQFFEAQLSLWFNIHTRTWLLEALTIWTFVSKGMSLLFNMLSRFIIAFLPRSKCLLISCLQSLSAVILEPKKIKSVTASTFSWSMPWSDGTGCHDLRFLNAEFQASFFTLLFRGSLFPLHFLPLEWYHLPVWGCWYFSQQSWF